MFNTENVGVVDQQVFREWLVLLWVEVVSWSYGDLVHSQTSREGGMGNFYVYAFRRRVQSPVLHRNTCTRFVFCKSWILGDWYVRKTRLFMVQLLKWIIKFNLLLGNLHGTVLCLICLLTRSSALYALVNLFRENKVLVLSTKNAAMHFFLKLIKHKFQKLQK